MDIDSSGQASANELASGGARPVDVYVGADGARSLYQSGATYALITGANPDNGGAEGTITLNASNLSSTYFNPTPGSGSVPARDYDAVSILEHELGHIFGIDGFRDSSTGALGQTETAWDQLVQVSSSGSAVFVGSEVVALYGAPAPITTLSNGEAYFHFGNSSSDADASDLMSGTGLPPGITRTISPLDIAVMADIGTPLSGLGTLDLAESILLRLKSFSDLPAPDAAINANLAPQIEAGASLASLASQLLPMAAATTSVATMAYEFFTQTTPTLGGLDYLVSPEGANPNNLNSRYYAQFNTENRYINFAVNLGSIGAGAAAFTAAVSTLSLAQVVTNAYAEIFGTTPSAALITSLLDAQVPNGLGGSETRAQYFSGYGLSDVGTKAAAVGWLLGEAVTENVGVYAAANDSLLTNLASGVSLVGTDMIAHHLWTV